MSQQRRRTPPQFKLPLIRVSGEASPNNYLQKSNRNEDSVTTQKINIPGSNTPKNLNNSFLSTQLQDKNNAASNIIGKRRTSVSEYKKLNDVIRINFPEQQVSKSNDNKNKNGNWRPHQLPTQQLKEYLEEMEMKDRISFNIKFYDIIPKLKAKRILKYWVIALRAVIRLRKLSSSLLMRKNRNINVFNICIQEVIYNDQLKTIKFKQWTQMVFSKVIACINRENLNQSLTLNIIDHQDITHSQHYDMARLKLSQLIKLMLDGLLLMTCQQFFLKELACEMYVQQFENHRKNFYIFTTLRTSYLKHTRDELPQKEQAMIFTEFIVNILVNNLAIISQTELALNFNETNAFLMKLLISFLQYLYFNSFYKLKTKPIPNTQTYTQNSMIKRKGTGFDIIQSQLFGEAQELVSGTYNINQLKPLLDQTRWLTLMKSNFNQIIRNLQSFDITKNY